MNNQELQQKLNDQRNRQMERFLSSISTTNQETARTFIHLKRGRGAATSTLRLYAHAIERLDASLNGKAFRETTETDATNFLNELRNYGAKPGTIRTLAQYAKGLLTHVLDVETLPRRMRTAFRIDKCTDLEADRLVTDMDFSRLLASLPTLMDQALAAIIWESGFRLSEALSLYVGSIVLDEGGGAWLNLPKDGADLKTGARQVYITNSQAPSPTVPLLRAWLQSHPEKDNPKAPLWIGDTNRNLGRRIQKCHVHKRWEKVLKDTGIERFTPHDLRHTAATRDAEHDATETDLRVKYGWSDRSTMPSYYVKRRRNRQEAIARRSVGIDPTGQPVPSTTTTATLALAVGAAVEATLKKMGVAPR